MIDNPATAERLLAALKTVLPLPAVMCPSLAELVEAEEPGADGRCAITGVHYTGDAGGIMCSFEAGPHAKPFVVSLTYFVFDRRAPIARKIAAYVKHRRKGIRRGLS